MCKRSLFTRFGRFHTILSFQDRPYPPLAAAAEAEAEATAAAAAALEAEAEVLNGQTRAALLAAEQRSSHCDE